MRWIGYWQGIELFAESEDDEKLLDELIKRVPTKAAHYYDDGILEEKRNYDTGKIETLFFGR